MGIFTFTGNSKRAIGTLDTRRGEEARKGEIEIKVGMRSI
jgi:hypothetical protein